MSKLIFKIGSKNEEWFVENTVKNHFYSKRCEELYELDEFITLTVHVINVGLLENTSVGKFFLTTLLTVAEMKKNIIIECTQAGKEVAKTK